MTPLPAWLNRRTLRTAALCAGGAMFLLHPASLLALGAGVYLGYKGKDRLYSYFLNH